MTDPPASISDPNPLSGHSSDPIRVAIIQPSLARYRVPVYRHLAKDPHLDIRVIYGQDEGIPNEAPDGFPAESRPHRYVGIGRRRPFVWQPAQLDQVDRARTDVLVTVWNTRWLSLYPMIRRARRKGVRTVLWGHGYSKNESGWRRWLRMRLGREADAVLFYSRSVADTYAADGFPSKKIFVAPNSLDQSEIQAARNAWTADPERLDAFRRDQKIDEGPTVLYVSRFDPANRVDLLLDAAKSLKPRYPGLQIHLVGKGEPTRQDLESKVRSCGLEENVRFLGAIYGESELAPWFLTADVFCYPQNIGLSLHHAMGYGLPVVTGNDESVQNPEFEALSDGENARLFRSDDTQDLARILNELFSDPKRTQALGREARRTATEDYGVPAMARGMAAAIRGNSTSSSR